MGWYVLLLHVRQVLGSNLGCSDVSCHLETRPDAAWSRASPHQSVLQHCSVMKRLLHCVECLCRDDTATVLAIPR